MKHIINANFYHWTSYSFHSPNERKSNWLLQYFQRVLRGEITLAPQLYDYE